MANRQKLKHQVELWLKRTGLTQARFGKMVMVPQATVNGWMSGAKPHDIYLRKIKEVAPECPIYAEWKAQLSA